MPAAAALPMTDSQREILETLGRSRTAPHREVQRARVLLLAADGMANAWIAEQAGVSVVTVRQWRARFEDEGLARFGQVRAGRGRKPSIPAEKVAEIVRRTREETPDGQTHWSCRSMAKAVGVSPATVQRIWSARGLKPHLVKTFKLSHDPQFEEKLVDVVGLYLDPPEKAIVLCMDETSSVQALDRTQPSLPMVKGRAGTIDPRLQAAWHDDVVRRARRADRPGDRLVPAPAPPRRIPPVPARHRQADPQGPGRAPDPGQLQHSQASRRAGLAHETPTVPAAFHADLELLAQPRRALVP